MSERVMRVLLVEDNPADARLIGEMLRNVGERRFELHWVTRLSGALDALRKSKCDVILLDLVLDDSAGLDTLEALRPHAGPVPLIILTSLEDREIAVSALQGGARDYLVKDRVDAYLLARAILRVVEPENTQARAANAE